jgi:cysteine desulfurase
MTSGMKVMLLANKVAPREVRSRVGSYIGAPVHVAIGRNSAVLSGPGRLYLDHAATTPVLPEARAAIGQALEAWANPSSPHADGRRARAAFEQARRAIAEALGWRHDVILTSGASEAVQIAAARAKAERRIVGPTEHDIVIAAMGKEATVLRVDANGLVNLAALEAALADGPALVAVQLVNNETGVIQPIAEIQELVSDAGSLLLADCAQAASKIALPDADFIAVSGHKFGGPPGVGALLARDLATLQPSGGQERGYRRGTENWPAVAGIAAALGARAFVQAMPRLVSLQAQLEREIVKGGGLVIASAAPRLATIGAYAMPGVASASQLVQLDLAGISVSAGSACSSGSMKPSRVLAAMGVPELIAGSVIRVSFGPDTSQADVDRFTAEWRRIAARAKAEAA